MRPGSIAAAFLVSAMLLCVVRVGLAQPANIDAERFKPAVTHDGFVTMEGSGVRPTADPWEAGLFLNYSRNSLVVIGTNGDVTHKFISGRLGFDAMLSVTLAKPFAIGLDIPFFLAQTGDSSPSFAGLGDIRVVPKVRIIDGADGFGLGISGELRAPTHAGDFAGGARMIVFAPRVIVDWRHWRGFHVGANAGVNARQGTTFLNVDALSEFAYALGLGYRFGGYGGKVELGAEAAGAVGFTPPKIWEVPLEGFIYGKINPNDEWEIQLGPGFGLVRGYGIPLLRVFAGVRYTPTSHDRDHDGIPDDVDKCPDQPENRNGYQDVDGCPDEDGDDDHDGVPNSKDQCPNEKETINGIQDDDGCPDGGPAKVIREEGKFRILENVRFRSGSAQIDPASYSILDQVALTLKANPDIKRVRIEGHTDDTGSREVNIQLSKARASAVREYLIAKGVKPDRLRSEGYGPDKPIATGSSPESRAKNRRVEFIFE
jgi:outer membrane protein OmpA-like peptidoglycan-associated protein